MLCYHLGTKGNILLVAIVFIICINNVFLYVFTAVCQALGIYWEHLVVCNVIFM